jgi:hypothetical protein
MQRTLVDLIPAYGIPPTWLQGVEPQYWFGRDTLENFRDTGGHPLYGEKDVVYTYSSMGYRGPEFDVEADIKIVSLGCSWTMGVGVPQEVIFHEVFAERLRSTTGRSVVNWNLGVSGASNDMIARMAHHGVPFLNPDIVLISFTAFARREYFSPDGQRIQYTPNSTPIGNSAYATVFTEVAKHYTEMSSVVDDQFNFYRNFKSVECLLADKMWLYSINNAREIAPMLSHVDATRYGGQFKFEDKARDNGHPGPITHRNISDGLWNRFVELGYLETLQARFKS